MPNGTSKASMGSQTTRALRARVMSGRGRGCRRNSRAFYQQVEHDRQFAEQERLRPSKSDLVISSQKHYDPAQNRVAETIDHQPNAEPSRHEFGAIDEQPEGKEPKAPKKFIHEDSLIVQTNEEITEGVRSEEHTSELQSH